MKTKLVLYIECGVLTAVLSNKDNIDVRVVDYDCDGDDLKNITVLNGDKCYLDEREPLVDTEEVEKVFKMKVK